MASSFNPLDSEVADPWYQSINYVGLGDAERAGDAADACAGAGRAGGEAKAIPPGND